MNKWSQIKTVILDKLFLSLEEAQMEGFVDKFQHLANECLIRIANDVKENIKLFEFNVYETQDDLDDAVIEDGAVLGTDGIYRLVDVEYHLIDTLISMPSDFISYDNEIEYDGDEDDYGIRYMGRNKLMIDSEGFYRVSYNALYPEITLSDITNDTVLDIDNSVLYCIPSYVASQLLLQNDPQRSIMLRNEFELFVSRLDNNVLYDIQNFRSKGGWY